MNPCINLNVEPPTQESSPTIGAPIDPILEQRINHPEAILGGEAMEVISRIYNDNKKMSLMVADIFQKYSSLHSQLMQYLITNNDPGESNNTIDPRIKKRNGDHLDIVHNKNDINIDGRDMERNSREVMSSCFNNDENCCKRLKMINFKPKVARVLVRVDSSESSLAVKDGYQWRKYGQKVTRDNPSPRAYFKCSFAPLCPVKKKVQKSVEDPKFLVVTYEGEHTHKKPPSHGSNPKLSTIIPSPSSSYISSPDRLILQNLSDTNHKERVSEEDNIDDQERSPVNHWLVEQMASSLTKDPSFTSTLAAAISDKVLKQTFY